MNDDIKRNCKRHGFTIFRLKKSKTKSWYSCHKCLKEQWRKASAKLRKNPENMEYHKAYSKENYKIRKSLSVYLTMILLAAKIKPK